MKRLLVPLLICVLSSSLHAEDFSCPEMPSAVTSVNHDVKTEVDAAVGAIGKVKAGEVTVKTDITARNLFEKFPNVDKTLSIQIMAATYCSMLKKSNLSDKDRLSRWEKFQTGILQVGSRDDRRSPDGKMSLADRLLLDENPTKLNVSKVVLEQWVGDSEPYVTLVITNISKRTAVGVRPYFSADRKWTFEPTRTSSLFMTGVSVEAGAVAQYPVAPLAAFVEKTRPPCGSCSLVGVGTTPSPPDEIVAAACQGVNDQEGCNSSYLVVPFGINLEYRSIFDQKESQFFAAFAYFKNL